MMPGRGALMQPLNRTVCPKGMPELKEIAMKKLHSLAFYALVAPVITLGAGSALAEKTVDGQNQSAQDAGHPGAQAAVDRMQSRTYMNAVLANGMHASDLISAHVRTTDDVEIGSVNDLIIDKDGRIVALVVSVGGFLGMGEKDVAIGWDHVTRSGATDDQQLRVDVTRDDLLSAP